MQESSMTITSFDCPWCSALNIRDLVHTTDIDVACSTCKQPIDIQVGLLGSIIRLKRVKLNTGDTANQSSTKQTGNITASPAVHIGTNYGSVAFGGNATTITNIYEQTIKEIEQAQNVSQEQKRQAKGILEHANAYAKPFLPIIAAAVKHGLGIS